MGFAYLLKAETPNVVRGWSLVKIGMTDKENADSRIKSIQAEWLRVRQTPIVVLAVEESSNARYYEQQLHQKFSEYRKTAEEIQENLGGKCSGDSEFFLVPDSMLKEVCYAVEHDNDTAWDAIQEHWMLGAIAAVVVVGITAFGPKQSTQEEMPEWTISAQGHQGTNLRKSPNGEVIGLLRNGEAVAEPRKDGRWCDIGKGYVWCDNVKKASDVAEVSLAKGTLTYKGRTWKVAGSRYTPQGTFTIDHPEPGANFGIPESKSFLPFSYVPKEHMDKGHPSYMEIQSKGLRGIAFGIHTDNRQSPNDTGLGCLLVSASDLEEISQSLPGKRLKITP